MPASGAEDKFVSESNLVKDRIREKFKEFKEQLDEREAELIRVVDEIVESYLSYQKNIGSKSEERKDIEILLKANEDANVSTPKLKELRENILAQIREQLKELKIPDKPELVTFCCNPEKFLTELRKLGELVERVQTIDYTKKEHAVSSVCKRGERNNQLKGPNSVAVDPCTGKIFIVDKSNYCIKVFDSAAKFQYKFGDTEGEGMINYPRHLTISGAKLFLCQGSCSILAYQLEGEFISKVGVNGAGELEFSYPWSLTTKESGGDIYVCDLSNNRVQIISEDFKYKSQFGNGILNKPRHIKVTKDNIFILDESSPCLHVFGNDFVRQTSVITTGEGRRIVDPHFFFIDRFGNFLISDNGSDSIVVLNSEFKFVHKIAVSSSPMELTMDVEDRIVVVCQADSSCLQIF